MPASEGSQKRKREYNDAWRIANSERVAANLRAWRTNNPERCKRHRRKAIERLKSDPKLVKANREYHTAYIKKLRRINPYQRLIDYYRRRINVVLHKRKSNHSLKLLGCDLQWLIAWLEIQFQPGMTWDNLGQGWHVDHKKPCASFDLNDRQQQKLCFHWTNLQPLWAVDNLSKGATWESGLELDLGS
jgi:hypothetical protein